MTDMPPTQPVSSESISSESMSTEAAKLTPFRCVVGSAIAGILAYAMYWMTSAIALSFAVHKIHSSSLIVQRVSAAVRTLVIGMTALGTGVFGLAAIGLFALAMQLIWQRTKSAANS